MNFIYDPDDEMSKAFAAAYHDGSHELSFLGKEVIVAKDKEVEE